MKTINEFWEVFGKMKHAQNYGAKYKNLIEWDLRLQSIVKKINNQEIENSKYRQLLLSYKNGYIVKNSFGKKLYFKKSLKGENNE